VPRGDGPITEGNGRENVAEFQHLLVQLRRDLQPATTLEEMLIERVASCYWRLGRCVRAETAAIESRVEALRFRDEQDTRQRALELNDDAVEPAERIQDLPGVESVLEMARAAQDQIETEGFLDAEEIERFQRIIGYTVSLAAPAYSDPSAQRRM